MTKQIIRANLYIGSGAEGRKRKAQLLAIAADIGAVDQSGTPSIASMLQLIADGDLTVKFAPETAQGED